MVRIILLSIFLSGSVFAQQAGDGTYRVEQERKVTHDINDEQLVTYTILDREDREVYSVTREVTYDAAFPAAGVFASGRLVLADSFTGTVEFYDTSGDLLKSVVLPDADDVEHERKIDFSFHNDRAAFLISEPDVDYVRFVVFNEDGELLTAENIDAGYSTGIVYAPDGSLLALGTYSWVGKSIEHRSFFITDHGRIAGDIAAGFENGSFSEDGSEFIGYSNSQAHLIDTREFTIRWSHKVDGNNMIIEAAWNTEGIVILSSQKPSLHDGGWRYENPVVKTLEQEAGNVVTEQRFPGVTFTSGTFRRDNDEIDLLLDDSVHPLDR